MSHKMLTSLGMMSGTSLDGIDAAIIRTDGEKIELTDYFITIPYADNFRKKLRDLIETKRNAEQVEKEFTAAHAEVVRQLLDKYNLKPEQIDIIGFHGQTIDHRPYEGFTWQIGDGALLAELTGINVVNDFRTADVKAGGQGAPLVPLFHAALFKDFPKPLSVLNIGGVANITYLGGVRKDLQKTEHRTQNTEYILAFDTGPGNAMIDDLIYKHTGRRLDEDGQIASSGIVNNKVLEKLLADDFYSIEPPKSLDRNHFKSMVEETINSLSLEDGAATLVAFTTEAAARSMKHFSEPPLKWYITGGGRYNKKIMEELEFRIQSSEFSRKTGHRTKSTEHKALVVKIEEAGFNGDALEAQAFAFLAVRSLRKLPLSLPTTTGVKSDLITGGILHRAVSNRVF